MFFCSDIIIISWYNQFFRRRWETSWSLLSVHRFYFHYDLKAEQFISICFSNNSIVETIKQNANKLPWQYVTEGINIFSIDLSFLNEKSGMRKLCIFPNVYRQTYYSTDTTFSVPVHKFKWYVLYYFVKHELWIIIQNIRKYTENNISYWKIYHIVLYKSKFKIWNTCFIILKRQVTAVYQTTCTLLYELSKFLFILSMIRTRSLLLLT